MSNPFTPPNMSNEDMFAEVFKMFEEKSKKTEPKTPMEELQDRRKDLVDRFKLCKGSDKFKYLTDIGLIEREISELLKKNLTK